MAKDTINTKADLFKRVKDAENKAKRYGNEAKAYKFSEEGSSGTMKDVYKTGRDASNKMANMAEEEAETLKQRLINSREQYQHEKEQGDPYATRMSYEEWKKL